VELAFPPGNCFNVYNKFTLKIVSPITGNTVTATAYEYQNGEGHCLWENEKSGVLELGTACKASDSVELFYVIPGSYLDSWTWTNVYEGRDAMVESQGCSPGSNVVISSTAIYACDYWKSP
jgi:hypothetical protein